MTGYAHVLKYNAHGINQYTKGNGGAGGSAPMGVQPVFSKGKKINISDATSALSKQGITMEHAGMTNFSPSYKLTDKSGKSVTVGAKELTKMLTKKDDINQDDIAGYTRQEQAKNFITALS